MRGLIIRSQSGFYTVETETGNLTCHLRGRLKQGKRLGDIVAVGDWVQITQQADETGMIEAVEPRQRMLSRMAPTPRGEYQQIIIANPDQAVFVFACAKPEPHPGMLDRFLVVAEKQGSAGVDRGEQGGPDWGCSGTSLYFHIMQRLGYPLIYTSAKSGLGILELDALAEGQAIRLCRAVWSG